MQSLLTKKSNVEKVWLCFRQEKIYSAPCIYTAIGGWWKKKRSNFVGLYPFKYERKNYILKNEITHCVRGIRLNKGQFFSIYFIGASPKKPSMKHSYAHIETFADIFLIYLACSRMRINRRKKRCRILLWYAGSMYVSSSDRLQTSEKTSER